MKTNLIFKRQVTVNGVSTVATRIIPVDIPFIESGEGWILSGHSDTIEVMSDDSADSLSLDKSTQIDNTESEVHKTSNITKFISDVTGTAKLVRNKGTIKIVARRGKSTYNQTTSNSVCINDASKNIFFQHCRKVFGQATSQFEFTEEDNPKQYAWWSNFIDAEYIAQKERFLLCDIKENS